MKNSPFERDDRIEVGARITADDFQIAFAASQRPNQSSEPTPTSVTTPAAQEIAPAAVVAHL